MINEDVLFLWQLLEKDRRKRLACGPLDFEEIRQHHFFRDLSWDDLNRRKIPPCYRPELVSIRSLLSIRLPFNGN